MFGVLSKAVVLPTVLISRTLYPYIRSAKVRLKVRKMFIEWNTIMELYTENDKTKDLMSSETRDSSSVSEITNLGLFPVRPQPPAGKLNLIRDANVMHVTPKEMYDKLRELRSEYVLQTFAANLAVMDKIHFALSLKRLSAVSHRLPPDSRDRYVENLLNDERFQVLVALITRKGRFYNADVQFNILRSLHEFGFPADHPSMKVFLQLVRRNINNLFLDQLVNLFSIISLLDDCDEKVFIREAIEQLVSLRKDEINYLDDFEAAMLLDFFPDSLGRAQKLYLLSKIKRENYAAKLDHQYSHLLLRVLAKSVRSQHPIVDRVMLNRVVSACHRSRKRYGITELIDIVQRLKELRVYRQDMFDDLGDVVCDQLCDGSVVDKIRLLDGLCRCSHFHRRLCQHIESVADPDQLRFDELMCLLFCCWTYGYQFQLKEIQKRFVAALLSKLESSCRQISVDLYLELCLMLLTFDHPLPEALSDLEVVTSSEFDRKKISDEGDMLHREDGLKVIMPLREGDTGMFTASYTSCWSFRRQDVIRLIKEKWSQLPHTIEITNKNTKLTDVSNKVIIQEFDLYLMSAASEYDITNDCTLDNGVIVDYSLSKKKTPQQTDALKSEGNVQRLAVKLLPPCVMIRNQIRLKQPAALYMSCIQLNGYKTLVVTTHGWRAIPHGERASYLRWKINMAFSESSDDNLLII